MSYPSLRKIDCPPKSLNDYQKFTPDVIKQIYTLASSLDGLKIVHLNATAVGGGVAEMLKPEVALQNDIGLNSSLYIIPPDPHFFEITKKIHNLLQGKPGRLTTKEKRTYITYNQLIGYCLSKLESQPDIVIIHDPQPLLSISFLSGSQSHIIWRCHLDTTSPNKNTWNFLRSYLSFYDHFIFTSPSFIQSGFPPANNISFITPVIDPLSAKNLPMTKKEAKEYIKRFGINPDKPLITQISRLDPWKDPIGAINTYCLIKRELPSLQLAMVAQSASDDPEGERIYQEVKNYIKGEKNIFLLLNLPDNEKAVNAFQTASDIILQKSIREGFGLTVTEAMWKGAIVIAGNVGGIKLQIKNGVNGFLIDNIFEASRKAIYILKHPDIKEKISKKAQNTVRENFLLPHATLSYLKLFHSFLPLPNNSLNSSFALSKTSLRFGSKLEPARLI